MSKRMLGFALAGVVALAASPAAAVDVRNDDIKAHEILVSIWKDGVSTDTVDTLLNLAPGETAQGVCDACIVSLGRDEEAESVAAESAELVVIGKDGKIKLN